MSKIQYSVVDDSLRSTRSSYESDPAVIDLLSGRTIQVTNFTKNSSLYKVARAHNKRLHTRSAGESTTILWMEDFVEPELTELSPEQVEETADAH